MDNKAKSKKFEQALRRRILRPHFIPASEVQHFYKSHVVTHGFRVVYKEVDGKKQRFEYPIEIARFMFNPHDPYRVHIHYITDNEETARRMSLMIPKSYKPWMNDQTSSYSYGLQESWHNEPTFSTQWRTQVREWQGTPSANQVGPFWNRKATPTPTKLQAGDESIIDPWGKRHVVGEVSDIQIDGTATTEMSFTEKQRAIAERKSFENCRL
jgi:hypothetical protein